MTDYPLGQLLTSLSRRWGCEWRFGDAEETTVFVRARDWWLEDAADVPEPVLRDFRQRLGPGRKPTLDDLTALAELALPQIRKLVESGLCPSAGGLVSPLWFDGTGLVPCLRFYHRLSDELKRRATSQEGLPLSAAPPDLVRSVIRSTLLAETGAVTPELQKDLVFSIEPIDPAVDQCNGFRVKIIAASGHGTDWVRTIQAPLAGAPGVSGAS